jgi:transcriptional antiterminator
MKDDTDTTSADDQPVTELKEHAATFAEESDLLQPSTLDCFREDHGVTDTVLSAIPESDHEDLPAHMDVIQISEDVHMAQLREHTRTPQDEQEAAETLLRQLQLQKQLEDSRARFEAALDGEM